MIKHVLRERLLLSVTLHYVEVNFVPSLMWTSPCLSSCVHQLPRPPLPSFLLRYLAYVPVLFNFGCVVLLAVHLLTFFMAVSVPLIAVNYTAHTSNQISVIISYFNARLICIWVALSCSRQN